MEQLKEWLYKCSVQRLVVVISNIESGVVLERWQFDTECDKTAKEEGVGREKSHKAIWDEIRSVIRQITATVTFLPLSEVSCSFDLLTYADKDLVVPEKWEESGLQFITNSEEVHLRSFTTTIPKVNSRVAHKTPSVTEEPVHKPSPITSCLLLCIYLGASLYLGQESTELDHWVKYLAFWQIFLSAVTIF